MRRLFITSVCIFLLSMGGVTAIAADLPALTKLFKTHFWDDKIYNFDQSDCGGNVIRFAKLAQSLKIDLTNVQIAKIVDKGLSSLSGAHPYVAREEGDIFRPTPATRPHFEVGECEWFHHAILIADGLVIDFDYTNEARLVPLKDYFFHMFLAPEYQKDAKKARQYLGAYSIKSYDLDFKASELKGPVKLDGKLADLFPTWFDPSLNCNLALTGQSPPLNQAPSKSVQSVRVLKPMQPKKR